MLGILPKSTGLDFVIWLQMEKPSSSLYLEATPDAYYDQP